MRATRLHITSVAVALGLACLPAAARAQISGFGPDETIAQANGNPALTFGTTYSGALTSSSDYDYARFTVTAGESIHATVSNTLPSCPPPDQEGCPLYAVLMGPDNNQVGGSNSSAGTAALTVSSRDGAIDWKFAQGGTYYFFLQGDEETGAVGPSFTFKLTGSVGPVVESISVPHHQRGIRVRSTVSLARSARVGETVYGFSHGHRRFVVRLASRSLGPGSHRLVVKLPAAWRRKLRAAHRLKLSVRITVAPSSGPRRTYSRTVLLHR